MLEAAKAPKPPENNAAKPVSQEGRGARFKGFFGDLGYVFREMGRGYGKRLGMNTPRDVLQGFVDYVKLAQAEGRIKPEQYEKQRNEYFGALKNLRENKENPKGERALGYDVPLAIYQHEAANLRSEMEGLKAKLSRPDHEDAIFKINNILLKLGENEKGQPVESGETIDEDRMNLRERMALLKNQRDAAFPPGQADTPPNQVTATINNLIENDSGLQVAGNENQTVENINKEKAKAEADPIGYLFKDFNGKDVKKNFGAHLMLRFGAALDPEKRRQLRDVIETAFDGKTNWQQKMDKYKEFGIYTVLAGLVAYFASSQRNRQNEGRQEH